MIYLLIFILGVITTIVIYFVVKANEYDDKSEYLQCFWKPSKNKLELRLSKEYNYLLKRQLKTKILKELNKYRKSKTSKTGFILPYVEVDFDDSVEKDQYEIYFADKLVSTGFIYLDRVVMQKNSYDKYNLKMLKSLNAFIFPDGSQGYSLKKKDLKKQLKKEEVKLEDVCYRECIDFVMEEIETISYENLLDIVDLKYVSRFLRVDLYDSLAYRDCKGYWRHLSLNEIRTILLNLIRDNVYVGNKEYFVAHLSDCLTNFGHIYSANVDLVIARLKETLEPRCVK